MAQSDGHLPGVQVASLIPAKSGDILLWTLIMNLLV